MMLQWNETLLEDNATVENSSEATSQFTTKISELFSNSTKTDSSSFYPLTLVIPITVVYGVIFVTGVVGNVSTCIVIARNKSMHTATNYYLFSLAISDMLLLVSGLPPEMYRIWSPETYVFGEAFCVLQGFAAETSANATVLTITAFTVERYFAICHPFLSHTRTMSKLSRAVRFIVAIWIVALCLAAPQAIQFGVKVEIKSGQMEYSECTVVSQSFQHAFEISTFLFFVGPMTLITVLYVLIGIQLRKSRNIAVPKRPSLPNSVNNEPGGRSQNRVVNMLIAVVAAFFICWAPFHAQRLLAVYLANSSKEAQGDDTTVTIYIILMYASGILYFLSTTINPVLYHIMSNKFREAFKKTLSDICRSKRKRASSRTYSVLSKGPPPSTRNNHNSNSEGIQRNVNEELLLKNTSNEKSNNFLECAKEKRDSSFRHRVISETSQTTVLSTLSKSIPMRNDNFPLKPQNRTDVLKQKQVKDENYKYLGGIRHKMFRLFRKQNNHGKNHFHRQGSVESSNTISNSSLQDVEEIDYSSSDLVKYMEEINEDIT